MKKNCKQIKKEEIKRKFPKIMQEKNIEGVEKKG